jgi:hypothetical protein
MMPRSLRRQDGVALPVMMIILVVMLVSSVYLLKASNSSTMTTSNLAYESSLAKAADLGVLTGFQWLATTAKTNKILLDGDVTAKGYLATYNTAQGPNNSGFWTGSVTVTDTAGNTIEYVIHRMCSLVGPYAQTIPTVNTCVLTTDNQTSMGNQIAVGDSLASDSVEFVDVPQIHYVVTARIFGPRGGNVVTQAVVMIGA